MTPAREVDFYRRQAVVKAALALRPKFPWSAISVATDIPIATILRWINLFECGGADALWPRIKIKMVVRL